MKIRISLVLLFALFLSNSVFAQQELQQWVQNKQSADIFDFINFSNPLVWIWIVICVIGCIINPKSGLFGIIFKKNDAKKAKTNKDNSQRNKNNNYVNETVSPIKRTKLPQENRNKAKFKMTWNEWVAEWKNKGNYFSKKELIATFEYGSYDVTNKVYSEILAFSKLFGKDANMIYGFCAPTGNSRIDVFAGCFNLHIILMLCTVPESGYLVYWNNKISRPPTFEEDEMVLFNTVTSIWEDIEKGT